jgi:glycosyltransferase involved in cell wall biosynthesis
MRILFIVPYVPSSIRVRPYNLIRGLSARGHAVTVLTLWQGEGERADARALEAHCERIVALPLPRWRSLWNCARALPGRMPLQAVYCWQPEAAVACEALDPASFDAVHVEHLRGARYGLHIRSLTANSKPGVPVVWDSVDCISYLFEQAAQGSRSPFGRWAARLDLPRTRRYEGWLVGQFDRVLVTSQVDKVALEELPSGTRRGASSIAILPNGVDLGYFSPSDAPRKKDTLAFTGKMSYHANITSALYLVREIMPLIWRERPAVNVWIAGKDPPRSIEQLAAEDDRVYVTGTVPDLRPYLHQTTVAVVPLVYGAGTQFKVLEAMACGAPVVATPRAVGGLQAQVGTDLVVAEEAEAFADAVLGLLADPARRASLSRAGRRYVESEHGWGQIVNRLQEIYREAIADHSPREPRT